MKINREQLLLSLSDFVSRDSGVIIGLPGVGKSYILSQLAVRLVGKNIPACLLKLDNLTTGSEEDISNNLGMPDSDWINNLKTIPSPSEGRSIIIFDAFDTLRDEKLKDVVLLKIADIKKELPNWSIVVSVRTYDAHQSQKLIELFPGGVSHDALDCRKFNIPELSEDELQNFIAGQEKLQALYSIANDRLREIFRIPFYFRLLDFILTNEQGGLNSLSIIKSEIELLDRFWSKVVTVIRPPLATELTLKKLTSEMIEAQKLSVDKYDFLAKLSQEEILIVDRLLSGNVLKEPGVTCAQLSYSHNIFFDYAVSKLAIKDSADSIVLFIEEDPTRPLFLRPSFIYFFTRLWYQHRQTFWTIYGELSKKVTGDIQLFNKLIPSAVVVREFENASDIVWANKNSQEHRNEIRDILQGFRFLKSRSSKHEKAVLLNTLSENLNNQFVGDFCMLLNVMLEDQTISEDAETFNNCGSASRNLFDYCFEHIDDKGINTEHVIAYHAIPDVAKTFATNQPDSKKRLIKILDTINTSGFNIRNISNLLNEIKSIYRLDPAFVVDIYKVVFGHQETEDVATTMLRSSLLNFTSNRRDEFHLCHYRLKEFFPSFLKEFPEQAIPLALEICQMFITRRNQDGIKISDDYVFPSKMNINSIAAVYHVDMSHFWSSYMDHAEELDILKDVFNYFNELIKQNEVAKLGELINVYLRSAGSAYEWASLLHWAAGFAELLHDQLFDILLQPSILYWSDTIQQAGYFLEQSAQWLKPDQLKQIENIILGLGSFVPQNARESANDNIQRLLSRIPKDKLQTEEAKGLLDGIEPIANEPLSSSEFTSEPYTTQMFLRDQGVDINNPLANNLLTTQDQLSQFTQSYDDRHLPDAATYKRELEIAIETYDIIIAHPELDKNVVFTTLRSIASTCVLVLKSDSFAKDGGENRVSNYDKIREIVSDCLSRHSSSDTYAEEHYSPGSIFTTTPRSEAAGGLVYLYFLTSDGSLVPLITLYSNDKNSITRFSLIRSVGALYDTAPDLFWQIIMDRLHNEQDNFAWSEVVNKLGRKQILENEQDKLIKAFETAQLRATSVKSESKFFENFLRLTLAFFRTTGNAQVKELLLKSIHENVLITQILVWTVLEIIQPENFYRNLHDENDNLQSGRLVDLLLQILDGCETILIGAKENQEPNLDVEECFKILDQIVTRIYFSLQVNDRLIQQQGNRRLKIKNKDQAIFFVMIKPLLDKVIQVTGITNFMQPHTAHYFIEILSFALDFDPNYALASVHKITDMTAGTGYIQDRSALQEIIKFTEKLLGDHKLLLNEPEAFSHIKAILELYTTAGWPEALSLLWQLDEIFR